MYRFQGLDTLMSAKGITDSVTFDAYLKEVLAKRETQGQNFDGFVWDTPQLDFTYEQLTAEKKIEVMASYVDLNSPVLPAGHSTELVVLTGSIPRMKHAVVRGENDYRKQLLVLNNVKSVAAFTNRSETSAVSAFLSKELFFAVDEIASAFKNSLNYQIGQYSSLGELTIDGDVNPRGSIRQTIKQGGNKIKSYYFDKSQAGVYTETAGSDPISDLRDRVREIRMKANGYQQVAVRVSDKSLFLLFKHSEVLKAIGYALTGLGLRYTNANDKNAIAVAKGTSYEAQKEAFRQLIEADELIVNNTVCGVEKLNTGTRKYERTPVDAFAPGMITICPTGNIGVIKNVAPLRPDGQAIVGNVYGGRGLIEYMYNRDTREQRWQGELTALAVLTRPNDMYFIDFVDEKSE